MITLMLAVQRIVSIMIIVLFMVFITFTKFKPHMLKTVQQLWKASGVTPLSATAQIIDSSLYQEINIFYRHEKICYYNFFGYMLCGGL